MFKLDITTPLLMGLFIISACGEQNALEKIKETGTIKMLTRNNAHCYYTYRDKPCGFEYELAKTFSEALGVALEVKTPTWKGLNQALNSDEGDFIAANLSIFPSREKTMDFSDGYMKIQQKIVAHKTNYGIKDLEDLEGQTIHIRRGTSYEKRLTELKREGLNITIRLYDDTPTEEFIRMVAEKEIALTVADSNIAMLNRRYYPDVRIAFPIEKAQYLGWAVKKGETVLLSTINAFFKSIKKDGTFSKIYESYYGNVEIFDYVDLKKFHIRLRTRLPEYLEIIKEETKACGFDWRFIAAVIYQESHFNPKAKSYTGVEGIMQLTQTTAREMGVADRLDPQQSIQGGVRYLKKLYDRYDHAEEPDRFLMTLAAYNVGHGHVLDAQALAEKRELDPNLWSSLESVFPLLRYRKYYSKTQYGYCRGTEPITYINRILTYYDIMRNNAAQ